MSRKEKLLLKLTKKPTPATFTWSELVTLLTLLGFEKKAPGKTGGSRRKFINANKVIISLHEPHPGKVLKKYQIEHLIDILEEETLL